MITLCKPLFLAYAALFIISADYAAAASGLHLLKSGEKKIRVRHYPQFHRIIDANDKSIKIASSVKNSQCRIYRSLKRLLETKKSTIAVFAESLHYRIDEGTKIIVDERYSENIQQKIKLLFDKRTDGYPVSCKTMDSDEVELLAKYGAVAVLKAFGYTNLELIPTNAGKIKDDNVGIRQRQALLTKLVSKYNFEYGKIRLHENQYYARELEAMMNIKSYWLKNKNSEIVLVYGNNHDFQGKYTDTIFDFKEAANVRIKKIQGTSNISKLPLEQRTYRQFLTQYKIKPYFMVYLMYSFVLNSEAQKREKVFSDNLRDHTVRYRSDLAATHGRSKLPRDYAVDRLREQEKNNKKLRFKDKIVQDSLAFLNEVDFFGPRYSDYMDDVLDHFIEKGTNNEIADRDSDGDSILYSYLVGLGHDKTDVDNFMTDLYKGNLFFSNNDIEYWNEF